MFQPSVPCMKTASARGVEPVQQKRGVTPDGYQDYRRLPARDDLSAVLICTTWVTHSRIAITAMRADKNAAIAVGGAASVEECWQLVRTSEETGNFCMLLENICYGKDELTLFHRERQGLFGEIVHVQGGHGGVDLLVLRAFAESALDGLAPPIDVYDTAAWMSITCLSGQSAAMGGMPVAIPDFTNGMWIDREPFRRGKYCLEEVCTESFKEIAEEPR